MSTKRMKVKGKTVLETVKKILKKGNASKVVVKDESGKTLLNVPVTIAATGALLAPVLSGVAFGFALMKDCTVEIETN